MPKRTVIGVFHTTGIGIDVPHGPEPNNHVEQALARLKQFKQKRVGVEYLDTPNSQVQYSTFDYWRKLNEGAKESGITLVPLEQNKESETLHVTQTLVQWLGRKPWKTPQWKSLQDDESVLALIQTSHPDAIFRAKKIVDEFRKLVPNPRQKDFRDFDHVLSIVRSEFMIKRAKDLNLTHVVVGASHAKHWERLQPSATVEYYPKLWKNDQGFTPERILNDPILLKLGVKVRSIANGVLD